jgi:hypothetical protein
MTNGVNAECAETVFTAMLAFVVRYTKNKPYLFTKTLVWCGYEQYYNCEINANISHHRLINVLCLLCFAFFHLCHALVLPAGGFMWFL